MMTVVKLKTCNQKSATAILKDALKDDPDYALVVYHSQKDKVIWVQGSSGMSRLEVIGALEAAKQDVWNSPDYEAEIDDK